MNTLNTDRRKNRPLLRRPFLLISIATAFLAFPLVETFAETASITIEVLEVFDYPGVGNQTFANKINDAGEIAGSYEDSSGVTRGYFRTATGHLSAPIVEPNDTGDFTAGLGINNSRIICGGYAGSDGNDHGFFLSGRSFTEYDVAGAAATSVSGINDAGDFAGDYIPNGSIGLFQAFVSIGGSITPIKILGATSSVANQLNASNQYVGEFFDRAFIPHGFYGDDNGASRFDPPGSAGTILFGINDRGWIVGRYADGAEVTHGLLFKPPNSFVAFDYPGSTFTSLNGINDDGFICGRYIDASGISHGILARARRTMGNEADMGLNEERDEQDTSLQDRGGVFFSGDTNKP